MSNNLGRWDSALLLPTTFEHACGSHESLEALLPGPNPKHLAFAQAMHELPGADTDWTAALMRYAEQGISV